MEKVPGCECLYRHRNLQWFLSVHVDDIKKTGKTQDVPKMWAKLRRKVDLDDPESFLGQVSLGEAEWQLWSNDMQGYAQKCVERHCDLAHKTVDQLHQVSTPYVDDHQIIPADLEIVGELSETRSQIVLKCLYSASIGRPDLLWTVNYLARLVTKWKRACDLSLARLISNIHHTANYKQYCPRCRDSTFYFTWCAVSFWITHIRLCRPPCACKKQTVVSHSSTEGETASIGVVFRMEGFPAMNLQTRIIEQLHPQAGGSGTIWIYPSCISECALIQHANVIFHVRRQRSCDKQKKRRHKCDNASCNTHTSC